MSQPPAPHPASEPLFTAVAINTEGIDGESFVEGGGLRVAVASPTSPDRAETTNPEELLALSWVTCLNAAARVVAGPGVDVEARSEISLHARAEGGFEFAGRAELRFVGVPLEEAHALAAAAHERCPVSRMLSGRSAVRVTAVA
ncbi:OsmC family protein [Leucobacter sp. USCH14]|uniref:OsmC family protein n=1 Tax=Leucobacter sp. USCH14 TaxID=3024838 RepID=UPI0030B3E3CA